MTNEETLRIARAALVLAVDNDHEQLAIDLSALIHALECRRPQRYVDRAGNIYLYDGRDSD